MRQVQYFKETVNRRKSFVTFEVKQIKFVFFSKQNSNISREIWVSRFGEYGDCRVQEYDAQRFGGNSWLWEVTDAWSLKAERGKEKLLPKETLNELTSRQFWTGVRVDASLKPVNKLVRGLLSEQRRMSEVSKYMGYNIWASSENTVQRKSGNFSGDENLLFVFHFRLNFAN
jgi:hypothetical protein